MDTNQIMKDSTIMITQDSTIDRRTLKEGNITGTTKTIEEKITQEIAQGTGIGKTDTKAMKMKEETSEADRQPLMEKETTTKRNKEE